MLRRFDFRAALIAASFFAIGFLVADRMTRVEAAPLSSMQDNGQAFSGNDGAVVMKVGGVPQLIIVRAAKLYRVDPAGAGHFRSFATIGE
jgi:hypothetical protein